MSRVENIFGPRESWGKGDEWERVAQGRERAKDGATPSPTSLRSATSPKGGGKRNGRKREERTVFNCKACGQPTKLENMKSIHMLCPRCGFKGNYRTNRIGTEIQMECLNCSMPVNFRRNEKGDFVPEESEQ